MYVPSTLADAELLLKNYSTMNQGYPNVAEVSSDNYYLKYDNWIAMNDLDMRNCYYWSDERMTNATAWQNAYKVVYIANQVLNVLSKIDTGSNTNQYKLVKGSALFFRAFAFHQLVVNYTGPYIEETASQQFGIPLRLSPDMDLSVSRASLAATLDQIIGDLKHASNLLPNTSTIIGFPNKVSALGMLSRVLLDKGSYEQAYHYADSSLLINSTLMDYNGMSTSGNYSFTRFNNEVLFPATARLAEALTDVNLLVDTVLYQSFQSNDLRRGLYFKISPSYSDQHSFKGSYDRSNGTLFVGLANDEVYLNYIESAVRTNKITQALAKLNYFLQRRYNVASFAPVTMQDSEQLLSFVLSERRKELLFRGRRWADLKRLNNDSRFAIILNRKLKDANYQLVPKSMKYALLLPENAVLLGGLIQNSR